MSAVWAIAEVTDSTPENLEYGDYRGLVLLADDVFEQNLSSVDEGVRAFAAKHEVSVDDVQKVPFAHDQYSWYRTLEISQS